MYQNAIYRAKFADFPWKNADVNRTQEVCHVIRILFGSFLTVPSFIIVGYVWQRVKVVVHIYIYMKTWHSCIIFIKKSAEYKERQYNAKVKR